MPRCSRCPAEVPPMQRFCGSCGAPVAASELGTIALTGAAFQTPGSAVEDRFPPGAVLAQRYRIAGKLGHGGMGEVYKATDLLIGQAVALKFLPAALASHPDSLERFRNEVRIARQISHPNVCRVYDMGEADAQLFITMEYVDGEDLSSLLRRIGRLPPDKASEIARRLCAGLAAAHEKGVLHRDLKPPNVMIDGRGQVRITDFGLAVLDGAVSQPEIRSGTPAYMAPEQLAGKEVTIRSDIYALGLVLFEIFTGKHPFEADNVAELQRKQQSGVPSLTSFVRDADPAAERIIAHCLDPDPARRPATALSVAAALPGGDPLAAALEAGETPSPEMVAAAGAAEGMHPRWAMSTLAAVVAGLLLEAWMAGRVMLLPRVDSNIPPVAMAQKSRELLASFGYTGKPVSEAWGLDHNSFLVPFAGRWDAGTARQRLTTMRPPPVFFWYRTYPHRLIPDNGDVALSENNPPRLTPGASVIDLDPQGRLDWLLVVPPEREESRPSTAQFEWKRLFDAAGLDMSRFEPATAVWTPATPFDARAAWIERGAADPVRVEAAAWQGRPVYFWSCQKSLDPISQTPAEGPNLFIAFLGASLACAFLIGWRNWSLGRADLKGAALTAATVGLADMGGRLFAYSHALDSAEYGSFFMALANSAAGAMLIAAIYLAAEPFVRRHWPEVLISWLRLLNGGFRDPLVGRHVLIGFATAAWVGVISLFQLARHPFSREIGSLGWLSGTARAIAQLLYSYSAAVSPAFFVLLPVLLLYVLLRRRILAAIIVGVMFTVILSLGSVDPVFTTAEIAIGATAILVLLLRCGFLAMVAQFFWQSIAGSLIWTLDSQAWYFGYAVLGMAVLLTLSVLAFRFALAGHPLWKEHP